MERRKTNITQSRERRGIAWDSSPAAHRRDSGRSNPQGNGQVLDPAGKHGAAHTVTRLEFEEQESFRRLQAALVTGNRLAIDAAQTYWLRVAEVLRRLDRELEVFNTQRRTDDSA